MHSLLALALWAVTCSAALLDSVAISGEHAPAIHTFPKSSPVTHFARVLASRIAKRQYYIDTTSDPNNCGGYGYTCPSVNGAYSVPTCSNSQCGSACASRYDYDYNVGQCVDISSDNLNCGQCGTVCSFTGTASAYCEYGVCHAQSCAAGYHLNANGICVLIINLANDPYNCGTKGHVCPPVTTPYSIPSCTAGVCGSACANSYDFDYDLGGCRDVSSDPANCGACGSVCNLVGASAATCESGTCYASSCKTGYTMGNYVCNAIINTQTSMTNCGAALNVCPTSYTNGLGSICSAGVCQPSSCATGYAFNFSTHQCQNVATDVANCGAIGAPCSFAHGTGSCIAGKCVLGACATGYSNIGGVCTLINLTTDYNNCGAIGNVCSFPNGVGSCVSSKCTLTSCNTGYSNIAGVCTTINLQSDSHNCGALNNACPATYQNGGAGVCIAGVCQTTCNTGFGFDTTINACRDISSDYHNCGAVSHICTVSNGTPTCSGGVCGYSSCNTGYLFAPTLSATAGTCTLVNTTSDVNNCGSVGHVCPTFANGSGSQCVNSLCTTTCLGLYSFDPTIPGCRSTATDVNNCGSLNNKCLFPNGAGSCIAGVCTLQSCATGFQKVLGVCTAMDLTTDLNNCGSIGHVCSFPNGIGKCLASVCTYSSCATGYLLVNNVCSRVDTTSDVLNCGAVGKACPATYPNGGVAKCIASVCQTVCNVGYSFDFTLSYCRNTATDTQNCGSVGNVCSTVGALLNSVTCVAGKCTTAACASGYSMLAGVCTKIDTTSDLRNCGALGNLCTFSPLGASGACINSICTVTSCPTGYTLILSTSSTTTNTCRATLVASGAVHLKKRSTLKKTLCPSGESACPIVGSASYEMAVKHHFSAEDEYSGIMAGLGGYECLDTQASLESCGGCASTGEGVDCSKIRAAVGVGCDAGVCTVFSCESGWRPNLTATRCIKIHESSANRSHHPAPRGHIAPRSFHL